MAGWKWVKNTFPKIGERLKLAHGAKDVTLTVDTGRLHQGLRTAIESSFEAFLTKSLSKVANRSAFVLEAR